MKTASIGQTIVIADNSGDSPAIITKVLSGLIVNATAFVPMPEAMSTITLHETRDDAIKAFNRDFMNHGYWPAKG